MKLFVLFIIWLLIGLIGSTTLQNHQYGLFIICALSFPILSLILLFKVLGAILSLFAAKKKYREVGILEKDDIYKDSFVEQIMLDNPKYIGLLTKIDKKKIAEEYLAEQKKDNGKKE